MPRIILSMAFLLVCSVISLFQTGRADDGVDIFLKAVDYQRNHGALITGRVSYSMVLTNGGKSEEEINDEIDELAAELDRFFPDTPKEKNRYDATQSVKSKYSSKRHIDGTFQFDYSKDKDSYSKVSLIFDNNPNNQTINIEKKESAKGAKKSEGALYEAGASTVFVNRTASTAGDFSHFGRLQGLTPGLMAIIISQKGLAAAKDQIKSTAEALKQAEVNVKTLEIVDTKPFTDGTDGAEAITIESSFGEKITQRYIIVPALGYICPLEQVYDQNTGNLTNEYVAGDFFLNEKTGLYYPGTYIESEYNPSTGALVTKKEYKVEKESLSLNEPMSPADFALDVPEGIWVQDVRDGKKELFRASSDGVLSLAPGGLDLSKMSWLSKDTGEPSQKHASDAKDGRISFARIIFMLIGIFLVLIGTGLAIRNRKGSLSLFIFLTFLFVDFACLPIYAVLDAKEPKVIVTPSVLDFGHVRPVDSPVLLHFDINNRSSKQVVISDIVTGCGCTTVDFPKDPISPQKGTRASVKVNLLGRMGEFKSSILVKTNVGETASLEMRGVIETDIWYNGQAIRATATKDQRVVTANLVLYTVKYPEIEFDETGFNDTVSAKIVSRENNRDGETKIVLAVDINIGENDMVSSNLELTPTDKNIAPLVIPVYCERNYDEQSVPQLITKQVSLGVFEKGQRKFFLSTEIPIFFKLSVRLS